MDENRRLESWLHLYGAIAAFLVAGIPSIAYFVAENSALDRVLLAEAEINSRLISRQIEQNPDFWQFQTDRLNSLLERRPRDGTPESRRLLRPDGSQIAGVADVLPAPLATVAVPVYDSGRVVATLEVSRTHQTLLINALRIWLVSLLASGVIYWIGTWLPIRVLRGARRARHVAESDFESLCSQTRRLGALADEQADALQRTVRRTRTLLEGIGAHSRLAEQVTSLQEARECLRLARGPAGELEQLLVRVDTLLRLADEPPAPRLFDLHDCLRLTFGEIHRTAILLGVASESRIGDRVPALVLGNPDAVSGAVRGLVDGILRGMGSRTVKVEVSCRGIDGATAWIEVEVAQSGGTCSPTLRRLFADGAEEREIASWMAIPDDLDLAIARACIAALGGSARVVDADGPDAGFVVSFPVEIHGPAR